MSCSRGPTTRLFLLTLTFLLIPCLGYAQDEGDESDEWYRDCSDEALAEMETDVLSSSPAGTEVLGSGLTPEEADEVRRRIYEIQQRQIDQLSEMLRDMPADYSNRADVLFRLAEAHWEVGEADYLAERALFNACADDWFRCVRDEPCYEPIPDYSSALDQYREILRDHPSYPRADEVIFRLGDGLIQAEEAADGIVYLTRLTNNYPDSIYIPDARFLMGEHYFDNGLFIAARQNYEDVLNYQASDYYNFAIYKLGWVDLNEVEYRSAVQRFQSVLANIDTAEAGGEQIRFDMRNQAINDMLVAWSEIDRGWVEARQYLLEIRGEDLMRRKLLALADLYAEKGKNEEHVEVLAWFIESYPNDELIPQWMEMSAGSLLTISFAEYETSVREYVRFLDPNGTWWIMNEGNDRAITNARLFAETAFLTILDREYEDAERLHRIELYEQLADDYVEFFQRWPESDQAYERRFFFGELLYYQLERYPDAGEQYLEVVRMDPEGEHAHDSIVGALQSYDDLMMAEVPDINEERRMMDQAELELLREEGLVEEDLGPWSQRYVEVVEQFADLYPEDELIPVASWRAAELYRRANRIAEAGARFETIIQYHPTDEYAEEAAISAFLCFQFVEDWERIEYWARFLIQQNLENPDVSPERLQQAVAYAVHNQSQDLLEAGEEFQAAEMMIALYNEFPESEFAPDALFNAAAIYERARRIDTAIETYMIYLEAFPEDPGVPDATYTVALVYDSQAEFANAADWFEKVLDFPDFPERLDAMFNAARLREALSEFDRALELYDTFMEESGETELITQLHFLTAEIEEDRGNLSEAYDRYEEFRDWSDASTNLRLAATVKQARIRVEQGREDDALDLYESAYEQYGAGVMIFDDTGLPEEWESAPGWQFEDNEERVAALPYAAEARFVLADVDFDAAQAISLEYPEGRWRVLAENLGNRAIAVDVAQRAMFEVWWMGDAAWSVAAFTRIGELYKGFYDDMYALPPPDMDQCLDDGYSYDSCDQLDAEFNAMLYERMYPIETKALQTLNEALIIAHDEGLYTEWTTRAVDLIADVDNTIRVIGEEGVVSDNIGALYTGTDMILDLTETLERMEALEAQRQAEEDARRRELLGEDGAVAPDQSEGDGDGETDSSPENDGSLQSDDSEDASETDEPVSESADGE